MVLIFIWKFPLVFIIINIFDFYFMKDFLLKDDFNEKFILDLIENEVEESIHLDFKAADALSKSDGKRKEISKDISSFANSDGGMIIYGINELNHKASSISFIDGNVFTKEWLEQIISSTIQRKISNLKIVPIRFNGCVKSTIYIVIIPKSFETPHMCRDNRYYRRYNFESVQMEEYEIRELYNRRSIAKLDIESFTYSINNSNNIMQIEFEFNVINNGEVPESSYKLNVYFNNINSHIKCSWEREKTNYDYTFLENQRIKISAQNRLTIYPSEKLTVMRFKLEIETVHIEEALKKLSLEMILFYSSGTSKLESDLDQLRKLILNN